MEPAGRREDAAIPRGLARFLGYCAMQRILPERWTRRPSGLPGLARGARCPQPRPCTAAPASSGTGRCTRARLAAAAGRRSLPHQPCPSAARDLPRQLPRRHRGVAGAARRRRPAPEAGPTTLAPGDAAPPQLPILPGLGLASAPGCRPTLPASPIWSSRSGSSAACASCCSGTAGRPHHGPDPTSLSTSPGTGEAGSEKLALQGPAPPPAAAQGPWPEREEPCRLRQLDDPARLLAFLDLPERLEQLARREPRPGKAARLVQAALLVLLLQMAPFRLGTCRPCIASGTCSACLAAAAWQRAAGDPA